MTLPGARREAELDFPLPVRESVTTLPYHGGGAVDFAAGDGSKDLILVSELRRFENMSGIVSGTHTGGNGNALAMSGARFLSWGVEVGDLLKNVTGSTEGTITFVSETEIEAGIHFNAGNEFSIDKVNRYAGGRPIEIRKISLATSDPVRVRFDGTPTATVFDVELSENGTYFDENVRVVSRVAAIPVDNTTTPRVRFTAWGI